MKDKNKESLNKKKNLPKGKTDKKPRKLWEYIFFALLGVAGVGLLTAATVDIVRREIDYPIKYECEGVDEGWLADHPFVTTKLPKTFDHSVLHSKMHISHPTIAGYTFDGWYVNGHRLDKDTLNSREINLNVKTITCVAHYKLSTYQISFDLDGGSLVGLDSNHMYDGHEYQVNESVATTTYNCLQEAFAFPVAQKEGYNFSVNGWRRVGSDLYYEGCVPSKAENYSFAAEWSLRPYNISYSFEGEGVSEFVGGIINNNIHSSNIEKAVTLTEPFLKGYTFEGWFNKDGDAISNIPAGIAPDDDNLEIVGKFSPIVYQISYSDASNSSHTHLPTSYKRCSPEVIIPDINPLGYNFLGWLSSASTTYTYVNKIQHGSTGNITFTADVQLITYQISYSYSGEGVDDFTDDIINNNSISSNVTKSVTFSSASLEGYIFQGWFDEHDNEINEIPIGTFPSGAIYNVTGKFTPITYSIGYSDISGCNLSSYPTSYKRCSPTISIPSINPTGYTFRGWKSSKAASDVYVDSIPHGSTGDIVFTSDVELINYQISYTYVGEGVTEFVSDIQNVNATISNVTKKVTLSDASLDGYTFDGWFNTNGDRISEIPVGTFPSSSSYEVIGRFTPITYSITYVDETETSHYGLPTSYKRCSPTLNISDLNPRGYTFKGWLSNHDLPGVYVSYIPHGSTGDYVFTADADLNTYSITFNCEGVHAQLLNTFNLKDSVVNYTVKKATFSLPTAECPGYEFAGFFDELGNEVNPTIVSGSMVGDKTYTVRFTPISYSATLVNTKGSTKVVNYNVESSIVFEQPVSAGYAFVGWMDDYNHPVSGVTIGDAVNLQNFTLISSWLLCTYTISYAVEGASGAVVVNNNPTAYTYEMNLSLSNLSLAGYNFLGWTYRDVTVPTLDVTISQHTMVDNVEFTAHFEKITYTIRRSYKQNATGDPVIETTNYYVDTPSFTLPSLESDTREFVGWREVTTKHLYRSGDIFGNGDTTNYNLVAEWKYKGEGTLENPYQIYDRDQLLTISDMDKCYKLMNNIYIFSSPEDVWVPVGTSNKAFNGDFDGNHKTLSFVVAGNSEPSDYFGIFGYCSSFSNVHDFTINGTCGVEDNRMSTNLFGAVAAQSAGTIEKVSVSLESYLTSNNEENARFGNIVGNARGANIINCTVTDSSHLDVDAPNTDTIFVGGIAGTVSGGSIDECVNNRNVVGRALNNSFVGGFVGSRDVKNATHIIWSEDPTVNNPFSGSTNSSTVNEDGDTGMTPFSVNCPVGQRIDFDTMVGRSDDLIIGKYYYVPTTGTKGSATILLMCWMCCNSLEEPYFDYANAKLIVEYNL